MKWLFLILMSGCSLGPLTVQDAGPVDADIDTNTEVDAGWDCSTPPPDECEGLTCVKMFFPGEWINEVCEYPFKIICCPDICSEGQCVLDCNTAVCDGPPASYCNGQHQFIIYENQGTCLNGGCFYGHDVIDCVDGCDTETGC
jgi:hypothetical protein